MPVLEQGEVPAADRLRFIEIPLSGVVETLAEAVEKGLATKQKELPARFFYDETGSKLFEQITNLPEYYLTRCEQEILEDHAPEIVAAAGEDLSIIEFGSGSSRKTRLLIEAALQQQDSLCYVPIDISATFLKASALTLLEEYERLNIKALAAEYHDAMRHLPQHGGTRLFLFLGSNIGNFERQEAIRFLSHLSESMQPRDRFLLGADLVKDPGIIEAAYNDRAGITEQFNKNILARINHELGGHFNLDCFEHDAPFVSERKRVEMRLLSLREQTVMIDGIEQVAHFREGEYIHTENSHKYTMETLTALTASGGLRIEQRWLDRNRWFGLFMLRKDD